MIAIDNILVSDEVLTEQFVCDLNRCKGGCCVDGDAGAPLEATELDHVNELIETIKPYMTREGIAEMERQGRYVYDKEFGWVTPTINGSLCVYGFREKNGIVKCAFEQAYIDGKSTWKKPISCHLFPVRIAQSKRSKKTEFVNYEPRPDLCSAACTLGKSLKVPVYVFLKEALIRKYGTEFYETLEATAVHLRASESNDGR